ncbi:MAG TPA: hypothetical protein VEG84_07155 [Thermoanaerobaculia bacterium]|nr:hypothetical protein [Thermoanaerobaculia bacterium]
MLALSLYGGGAGWAEEPLRIGEIRIQCLDVFTSEEEEHGFLYRAADALHVETQTAVIRRFLLFREGETYDANLLAQTERNLRRLSFLRSASVRAGEPHDGVVDVDVETKDAWTTEFQAHLGRGGGETTWAAGIAESNVAGLGKQVGVTYDEEVQRTNRLFEYRDPALFGSTWSGGLLYADNSDGRERRVDVQRPFYSLLDTLSGGALWDHHELEDRIYAGGVVSSEYAQDHEEARLAAALAVLPGDLRARRLTLGIDFFRDDFQNVEARPDDVLPASRNFRYVFVGWEDVSSDFVTENFVDRGERLEDFNLGTRAAAQFGVSPKAFGADSTSLAVAGELSRGWRLGPESFVSARADFRTRLDGGVEDAILTGSATLVWRHVGGTLPQTTIIRLEGDRGWNLDRDVQFFADGEHGLRGYRLYAFEGNRRVVLNVEHRVFTGFEILQLLTLGGAAFVDTGTAVPPDTPLRFSSLRTDAGVGLRVGIARAASNTVLRLDCAYAFNADPLGHRGWLVSFSSGQAF